MTESPERACGMMDVMSRCILLILGTRLRPPHAWLVVAIQAGLTHASVIGSVVWVWPCSCYLLWGCCCPCYNINTIITCCSCNGHSGVARLTCRYSINRVIREKRQRRLLLTQRSLCGVRVGCLTYHKPSNPPAPLRSFSFWQCHKSAHGWSS